VEIRTKARAFPTQIETYYDRPFLPARMVDHLADGAATTSSRIHQGVVTSFSCAADALVWPLAWRSAEYGAERKST